MAGKVVFLAGGGGGIGSALLDSLIADDSVEQVITSSSRAACSVTPKLSWLELDYRRDGSVEAAVATLQRHTNRVDQFICATGYLHGDQGQPEKSLAGLNMANMDAAFRVNAAGPLELFAKCAPLIRAADNPRALFLSAQVGSIEDNHLGGWFSYRMAKAALNMGIRTAAIEAGRWRKQAVVVAVHPGTTRSALSKPYIARRKQPVRSAEESAGHIVELLNLLSEEHNGTFLTAQGSSLPW